MPSACREACLSVTRLTTNPAWNVSGWNLGLVFDRQMYKRPIFWTVNVNVKFILEQATKAQRGCRVVAQLFL